MAPCGVKINETKRIKVKVLKSLAFLWVTGVRVDFKFHIDKVGTRRAASNIGVNLDRCS